MGAAEIILTMKADQEAQIAKVETVKAEYEAKLVMIDTLATEVVAEKQGEYDRGFNEGLAQAGQLGGEGKIYSDAELEAEIKPREEKIAALEQEKVAMAEQALLDIEAAKVEAVAAFKADLKVKYDEQQVAESQGETGFATLLS